MKLDPDQQKAVEMALEAPCGVVTGGPGVGKTTTVKTALDKLDLAGKGYALCAPTGKAARRMQEATGRPAQTIHRLLGWRDGGFSFNSMNPLPDKLIICDESSMLDIRLAADLLDALRPDARIIFVGDANQLPPVGPGAFFRDIIASEVTPVVWLKTLHRAAQQSWVCRNAPRVLAGEEPELDDIDDFEWHQMDKGDVEHMGEAVLNIIRDLQAKGHDLDTIQVLSPMKNRKGGTIPLNAQLQKYLNPSRLTGWKIYDQVLKPGDRVMQTRNNYNLDVMNGEVGMVEKTNDFEMQVRFDDGPRKYTHDAAKDVQLAYAMTIHKSQGSEWENVIVVCHSEHSFMLTRQLLYTAITRSKDKVFIVGDEGGLKKAINTFKDAKRRTLLKERLRGQL